MRRFRPAPRIRLLSSIWEPLDFEARHGDLLGRNKAMFNDLQDTSPEHYATPLFSPFVPTFVLDKRKGFDSLSGILTVVPRATDALML